MNTKKLWESFNESPSIEFSVGGEASELPAVPGLTIEGIGEVSLPLFDNEILMRVIALCRQAPFGLGMDTLVDTRVRKTWQLEPYQFSFTHPDWNVGLQRLLVRVGKEMGCEGITCHSYKLLIYEAGGHFVFHRDTEKEPGMFATLVVQLPSRFTGGKLVVKHQKNSRTYDFGCASGKAAFMVHFAAHFADVEHMLEEVQSGIRAAAVYNICWVGSGPAPSVTARHTSAFGVASILEKWDHGTHSKLLFSLEHYYTLQGLSNGIAGLKGNDREKVNVLLDANNMLDPERKLSIYLAFATREIIYSGYDDERLNYGRGREQKWELSEDDVRITSWIDVAGRKFKAGEFVDVDVAKESLNEVWFHDKTVQTSVEYTGNEGSSKTTLYHRCVVVFWPAAHETALILSRGGVLAGMHVLESIANNCTLKTVAEQRAVEMKRFQSFFLETLLPILHKDTKEIVSSSLPSIASSICQVSDITAAHELLSQCIAKLGLCSASVSSAIVRIGDKFGWAEILSLVLPLITDLKSNQAPYGFEVFLKIIESNSSLLEDPKLKFLGIKVVRMLLLNLSPSYIPKLAKACLLILDCSLACEFVSHVSKFGIRSIEISAAILSLIHQFGFEAFVDQIPNAFSSLFGAEEEACNLLATLILENRDTCPGLLIPVIHKVFTHLAIINAGKKYASRLLSVISELKDCHFCRKLLADVLLPIGLGPIIADAVISISHSIGWSAIRDLVPALFEQFTTFCPEAYQPLVAAVLKEDRELGIACCTILARRALLVEHPLPAKKIVSLIVEVFLPLGDVAALTTFVSSVMHMQHSDVKTISDLVIGLRASIAPALLIVPPLSSIITKRIADITASLEIIPASPSWNLPNVSSMPLHHAQVVAFLQNSKVDQVSLHGFSNLINARKFVKQHCSQLPVIMQERGSGAKAYVNMSKTPQCRSDMLSQETRLLLQVELKELCALVPAQEPMSVQQSEPALAVGNNVSTCPSKMSKVNPELLQCTNHLSTSSETPIKRMKIED